MREIIHELAELVAKQKLVPFLGAGCSASMMPDWDSLVKEMGQSMGWEAVGDHLAVAQAYVDTYGRGKFCDFLKSKLEITTFDDEKGYIHLTVMNMGVPTIYTTNQDNVMEKGYEKYGKKFRAIITIDDFAEIKLSEQLYIKFHGDLNYPESIVFTQEDYERRIRENDNALNIRLRADLISKNLLFIGYSFRDVNIQKMFKELNSAFYGKLPKSYMIAYRYTDQLKELCDTYGIILIDPMKEIPGAQNHDDAFHLLLRTLLEDSRFKKFETDMSDFFKPVSKNPQKVVSKMEIEILEKTIREKELSIGIKSFREVCDLGVIALDFEERIVTAYFELGKKATTERDTEELSAAIFNLKINKAINKMKILSALMATSNVRNPKSKYGDDTFYVHMDGVPERFYILIAPKAVELVYKWGWTPTATLSWNVGHWIDRSADFESLPRNLQGFVTQWVDKMRKDIPTVAEHPVARQQRLKDLASGSPSRIEPEEIQLLEEFIIT
ncbi:MULTISPECIES: SIR2 family protein [unclassified Paenibacillus]|uniref:SIR2 family protein n=1 Tax=unclassified Paenibacillus TaxID=185978 RepID=UPI001AE8DF51|nr:MULTISPECIES: SIR2 family protein [unclassified Paenibacillus]MBP1154834.1 hypothetical protein [Paenibacillus sp. PvP091]MBP1169782.1 hypothetical protein [Paenibacillus sp. PvR098]MBP2440810.1 hypothetical protein [Paenibacillus sp. PvP052]